MYMRMNQLALNLFEVECLEWKDIPNEDESIGDLISIRFHMKSGKMYTRQVYENQFEAIKEKYKEAIGEIKWD